MKNNDKQNKSSLYINQDLYKEENDDTQYSYESLDFGCENGRFLLTPKINVLGCDKSPKILEICKSIRPDHCKTSMLNLIKICLILFILQKMAIYTKVLYFI